MSTWAERRKNQLVQSVVTEREKREELRAKLETGTVSERTKSELVSSIVRVVELQAAIRVRMEYFGDDPQHGVAHLEEADREEFGMTSEDYLKAAQAYWVLAGEKK